MPVSIPDGIDSDWYKILSPVLRPWELIVIWLVSVLIPEELNPIGFIVILSINELRLTLIAVEVPIPTDKFGLTFKDTVSPTSNWWDVDTETTAFILLTSTLICSKLDSIEYW